MGYNSTFSGSLHPNKPIPDELIQKINDRDLDLVVAVDTCNQGEVGDIVPWSATMHGYYIAEDAVRIQKMLDPYGIKLSGSIDRAGEEPDDFERIEAVKGVIYSRIGEVRFGKRVPVSADAWTVEVVTTGKTPKRVGWLCLPNSSEKKWFDTEEEACVAARAFKKKNCKTVIVKEEKPR